MVVGISTFAIVTAKIAEFLVRSDRSDESSPLDAGPEHFDLRGGEADPAP